MKKIILSLALALSGYCTFAQTNTFPSSGNVGIGTTSPTKLLTVYGYDGTYNVGSQNNTIAVDLFNYSNAGNIGSQINFSAGSQSTVNRVGAAIGAGVSNSDASGVTSYLTFLTRTLPSSSNLTERMRISDNGNVGIGTTTPNALLDVSGGTIAVSNNLTVGGADGNGLKLFGNLGNPPYRSIDLVPYVPGSAPGVDHVGLKIYTTNGGTTRVNAMTITDAGNVGIGTTSPDQKLTIDGTLHSKEVKVDNSIPVPDYVFEKSYKPLDLNSLKEYLNANHHLPEIPSAAEIEKNGLSLGEMNLKLLKKVEELTLYAISQREENQKLKEKQQEEEARITALEKALSKLTSK